MSLITEALKKARQEAARQDALHRGVPYAVGAVEPPRRNPLLPVLAGLGAGCLLGGILFATAWIAGWGPFAKPEPAAAPQVAQTAPPAAPLPDAVPATPLSSPPAVEVREDTPIAAVAPPRPQAPVVEPRPAPQPAEPAPEAPAPEPELTAPSPVAEPIATPPMQEEPAAPVPSAPSAPLTPLAAASGLEEGKVYAGEVPLPGGGSLRLNGIAYSQERPVVVLDGRVMGTGESIQGFTVVGIEAGRVKLQGHGATVFVAPN